MQVVQGLALCLSAALFTVWLDDRRVAPSSSAARAQAHTYSPRSQRPRPRHDGHDGRAGGSRQREAQRWGIQREMGSPNHGHMHDGQPQGINDGPGC